MKRYITDEYIAMCKAAEELRKSWEPQVGDWVYLPYDDDMYVGLIGYRKDNLTEVYIYKRRQKGYYSANKLKSDPDVAPLWTQGQIIDMLGITPIDAVGKFCEWQRRHPNNDTSLDELWLSFLMATKYGKVWDGVMQNWKEAVFFDFKALLGLLKSGHDVPYEDIITSLMRYQGAVSRYGGGWIKGYFSLLMKSDPENLRRLLICCGEALLEYDKFIDGNGED